MRPISHDYELIDVLRPYNHVWAITELSKGLMINITGAEFRASVFSDELMREVLYGDYPAAEFGEDLFYAASLTHIAAYELQTSEMLWERPLEDIISMDGDPRDSIICDILVHKDSIFFQCRQGVFELDASSGSLLWRMDYPKTEPVQVPSLYIEMFPVYGNRWKMTYYEDFVFIPIAYGLVLTKR